MRIALCSDEPYPVHASVQALLEAKNHQVVAFGSVRTASEQPWVTAAAEAARAVADGECDEGIFFCWSGTGICMAANKLPGIRAALCVDPGTARAARTWNHANVLCLSNRLLSSDLAKEIIDAWFEGFDARQGAEGVEQLRALDEQWRKKP